MSDQKVKRSRGNSKRGYDPAMQDRESSVRLTGVTRERYERMAKKDGSQKTAVLNCAVRRLLEYLVKNPKAFSGPNRRPWLMNEQPVA